MTYEMNDTWCNDYVVFIENLLKRAGFCVNRNEKNHLVIETLTLEDEEMLKFMRDCDII